MWSGSKIVFPGKPAVRWLAIACACFLLAGCATPQGQVSPPVGVPDPGPNGHFIAAVPATADAALDVYGQLLERVVRTWRPASRRSGRRRGTAWEFDGRNRDERLEQELRQQGLWSVWGTGSEPALMERIRAGVPVWVFLQENPYNRASMRPALVIGFDPAAAVWWLTGLDEPVEEWSQSDFSQQWSAADRHWILILPPDKATWTLLPSELHARGRYWMALGQYERAAVDFGAALTLEPEQPVHYVELADSHLRRQQYDAAEPLYRAALTLARDDERALNNLAYLLIQSEGDLEEALRLARRAVSLAPHNPRLLDTLGVALHRAGDPREAARILQRARARALDEQVETQITIALHLIAVYADMGDPHLARQTLADVLALDPRWPVPAEFRPYVRPDHRVPR